MPLVAYFIATCCLTSIEHYYGWLKYEWNGFDEDPSIYVLCCLISNFEAFRLLNLELFEALLLIKKLLIKLGVLEANSRSGVHFYTLVSRVIPSILVLLVTWGPLATREQITFNNYQNTRINATEKSLSQWKWKFDSECSESFTFRITLILILFN